MNYPVKNGVLSDREVDAVLVSASSPQIDEGQLGISVDGGVVWLDGKKLKVAGQIRPSDDVFFEVDPEGYYLSAFRVEDGKEVWSAEADTPLVFSFAAASDAVNHPSHYAEGWSNGAEVIDITENLNFNLGNVVKYTARAGKKDPAKKIEDLKKAAWYLQREIAREEA